MTIIKFNNFDLENILKNDDESTEDEFDHVLEDDDFENPLRMMVLRMTLMNPLIMMILRMTFMNPLRMMIMRNPSRMMANPQRMSLTMFLML
mgnify:FL=1